MLEFFQSGCELLVAQDLGKPCRKQSVVNPECSAASTHTRANLFVVQGNLLWAIACVASGVCGVGIHGNTCHAVCGWQIGWAESALHYEHCTGMRDAQQRHAAGRDGARGTAGAATERTSRGKTARSTPYSRWRTFLMRRWSLKVAAMHHSTTQHHTRHRQPAM